VIALRRIHYERDHDGLRLSDPAGHGVEHVAAAFILRFDDATVEVLAPRAGGSSAPATAEGD
jgi:hypothetical protein